MGKKSAVFKQQQQQKETLPKISDDLKRHASNFQEDFKYQHSSLRYFQT